MGPSQAIILIFLYLNSCVQRQLIASDLMKIRFLAFSSSFTACFADIYIILCFHSSTFYQLEQTCLRSSMFDGHCLRLSNTGFSFARDLYFESQNLGLAFFFPPDKQTLIVRILFVNTAKHMLFAQFLLYGSSYPLISIIINIIT